MASTAILSQTFAALRHKNYRIWLQASYFRGRDLDAIGAQGI